MPHKSGKVHGNYKHGHSRRNGRSTPTYRAWSNMKDRCLRVTCQDYPYYGGRGIKVCDRWLESFHNFLADMGEKPPGLTLDRINNNGNYEASNCRWAARKEQNENRGGRARLGAKLTPKQVLEIRAYANVPGVLQREIASYFGISQARVSRIKLGNKWVDI